MQKVPFFLFSNSAFLSRLRVFLGVSTILSHFVPGLASALKEIDSPFRPEEYTLLALLHAFFYSLLLTSFLTLLLLRQSQTVSFVVFFVLGLFFGFFLLFSLVLLFYPRILSGKKAEYVDKELLFALRDISLQVSSGVSLYHAFVHVSRQEYGSVSKEFTQLVQDVHRGISLQQALEKMTKRTRSLYLQRVVWQLINTLKAGASIKGALTVLISDLSRVQKEKIRAYAQELNILSLLYMLFAVVIPTLGMTMLVILSGFADFTITPVSFASFLVLTLFVQIFLITFIYSRRPYVPF